MKGDQLNRPTTASPEREAGNERNERNEQVKGTTNG